MARYDDLINNLLGKYIIGEGNRDVRDKKNKPKRSKGAPEQKFDKDEPDDDDTTLRKHGLKENIEGVGLAGIMGMGGTGEKYAPPGWSFVHDEDAEEHDKTGHLSDKELLAQVRKRGTAGKALLARAKSEIRNHKSITPETRDALARDLYAPWADEDESHKEKTFGGNKGDRVRRYNKKTGRKSEVRDYGSGSHPEESEERPSAGLSKKKKSAVAKKARAGGDIGKKGKGFDKVAKAAGGGEKGQKIAAAAMWKNVKR